jgi:hypothetical protein
MKRFAPTFLMALLAAVLMVAFTGRPDVRAQTTVPGQPVVPLGYCQLATLSSALGLSSCVRSAFTGTGSGTALTTTSVTGIILVGDTVVGTGVPADTVIVAQVSGTTGGAGVYTTSKATTSSSASLTGGGIPPGATMAYLQAEAQIVRFRDDGGTPTSSVGIPMAATSTMLYSGRLTAIRFIEATSGGKINAAFYR